MAITKPIMTDETGRAIAAAITSTDVAQARIAEINAAAENARNNALADIENKKDAALAEIPEDYTDLRNTVTQLSESKADAIVCDASGSMIALDDASNLPLHGLSIYGKTTQDGTPTPDAPALLVNVGDGGSITIKSRGKNLLNYDAWKTVGVNKGTGVFENNGVTITAGEEGGAYTPYGASSFPGEAAIHVAHGEVLALSWEADSDASGRVFILGYKNGNTQYESSSTGNNKYVKSVTYVVPEGIDFVRFCFGVNDAGETISYKNIQIEKGNAATEFEPYKDCGSVTLSTPNSLPGIPVTSGGNYTDENGQQWVCDEIDLERGVYVKRVDTQVYDGSEDEKWYVAGNRMLTAPGGVVKPNDTNTKPCVLSSHYTAQTANQTYSGEIGISIQASDGSLLFRYSETADATEWNSMLAASPVTVIYALVTPVETSLSDAEIAAYKAMHTNEPNTTVYNDAGAGMAVSYAADMKTYIGHAMDGVSGRYEAMMRYIHMPRIAFGGNTAGMTKDNAVTLRFEYRGAEDYINDKANSGKREGGVTHAGYAKVKWQGTSSINFPKKNYTVTFYSDAACTTKMPITLREKWGAQSKYCMKANFIDPSQCRNVVAAKLWGNVVMSRPTDSISYQALNTLPNAGAVDGYPILTFINGEYVGLYTMNIPKDEWTFGMADGEGTNVVLCGEAWNAATNFSGAALVDGTDWDYEVEPADKSWVATSFNKIYQALAMPSSTEDEIAAKKTAIEACVDIYSVLDYGIFINKCGVTDNTGKNQLMVTYDGVVWMMSAYDLDTAFGNHWSGAAYTIPATNLSNNLTNVVKNLYQTEYAQRKTTIDTLLSKQAICNEIDNFIIDVPEEAFALEAKIWPDMCGANSNAVGQIKTFVMLRDL